MTPISDAGSFIEKRLEVWNCLFVPGRGINIKHLLRRTLVLIILYAAKCRLLFSTRVYVKISVEIIFISYVSSL